MKNKLFFNKRTIINILILLVFSIIPFLRYGNYIIPESDIGYDINPAGSLQRKAFLWDDNFNFGVPNSYTINIFNVVSNILFSFGIPSTIVKQIWFSLLLFSTGLSMYYFTRVFWKDKSNVLRIISSLSYMYSLYLMRALIWASTMVLNYTLLPLMLGLYISGLERNEKRFKFAILIGLTSLLLANMNLTLMAINIIALMLCFLVFIIGKRIGEILSIIKFNIQILIIVLMLSFWCLVPLITSGAVDRENVTEALEAETPRMYNSRSSFTETLRLMGEWGFYGQYKGKPYVSFSKYYIKNSLIISTTFISAIIAFISLFLLKRDKRKLYLISLLAFSFPMAVGAYPVDNPTITGKIYLWFYNNIPFFSIFRNGYKTVGLISFVYALLLGYFTATIYFKLSTYFSSSKKLLIQKLPYIFILGIFGLILVNSFPLWMGKLFEDKKFKAVPSYWYNFSNHINNQKLNFRLLMLPEQYFPVYYWGAPSSDVAFSLLNNPSIENQGKSWGYKKFTKQYFDKIEDEVNLNKLLSIANARYVVQRNDINWQFYDSYPPKKIQKILSENENISLKDKINELDIYEINKNLFLPKIFVPSSTSFYNGDKDFYHVLSNADYVFGSALLDKSKLRKDISEIENRFNEIKRPILEYKKINPTKYQVILHQADTIFPLVFSESFHEGWKVYLAKIDNGKWKMENGKLSDYKILDGNEDTTSLKLRGASDQAKLDNILSAYKIFDGNEEDQADVEELKSFIDKGYISTLGNIGEKEIKHMKYVEGKEKLDYIEKYKIDFVSKNFQDTIQNDNLPSGTFFETWLASNPPGRSPFGHLPGVNKNVVQIPDENHLMVNGYANSWIIDPKELCEGLAGSRVNGFTLSAAEGLCKKNPDGSYDLELVVEFWPQRLFYVGLGISGITLLVCLSYLVFNWFEGRKVRGINP